jgi:hypothetical protein
MTACKITVNQRILVLIWRVMPHLWTGLTDPTRQVKALSRKKKVPRGRYCSPAEDDSGQIENCERGFSGSVGITSS